MQGRVARIAVAAPVREYVVALGTATRGTPEIPLGLSPRGLLTWQRVAQACAFLQGRDFITPDDVQDVALPVLGVRLGLQGDGAAQAVERLLASVPVPA